MSNQTLQEALKAENPLQIAGVINASAALLAQEAGFKALYLSGAGIANAAFGLPDLSLTTLTEVVTEVNRITHIVDLPLLVDGDTGFGGRLNIERLVKELIIAGAAGVHLEDQTWPKRCGHLPDKRLVSTHEMVEKLQSAVETRNQLNPDFVIMARTDALANEGLNGAIERSKVYAQTGADMIFAEGVTTLQEYQAFVEALPLPILANCTEFGKTPLFTKEEFQDVGVQMVLYPLSAFRAMNKAAMKVYQTIRRTGTQKSLINDMQTREELYQLLRYDDYKT